MKKGTSPIPPKASLVQLYRQALVQDVPLDRVDEKVDQAWQRAQVSEEYQDASHARRQDRLQRQLPKWVKIFALLLPLAFIVTGVLLLGSAALPILSYYIQDLPGLKAATLTSPIPSDQVLEMAPVIISSRAQDSSLAMAATGSSTQPLIINTELDYTNLSNWFGGNELPDLVDGENPLNEQQETYSVEIPKLKITNAQVMVGGNNLNKSLIQYPGTAEPGQPGAPVIFGHSVLRQFYNPNEKNPRRYNSIFSTIMTLQKGDLIYITRNNVKYTYMVQEKTEVKPEDTYILAQKFDQRALKLVTCVPEGTYLRRGVVTAVLVPGQ